MHNQLSLRNDIDALALRAWAAGGFGDAAIGISEPHKLLTSYEFHNRAREQRSACLREILGAIVSSVADSVRRIVEQWRQQRRARATVLALRGLDSRMLRDLGMHRSEILSVAAELARGVDSTRMRAA